MPAKPLLRTIDCVRLPATDLAAAKDFYCRRLGLRLNWTTGDTAGLKMPETNTEIVLYRENSGQEIDFLVDSADEAAREFVAAGGTVVVPPFDIQIGRAVVVSDPWGNRFVLLDTSKGLLVTDSDGNVIGNECKRG